MRFFWKSNGADIFETKDSEKNQKDRKTYFNLSETVSQSSQISMPSERVAHDRFASPCWTP